MKGYKTLLQDIEELYAVFEIPIEDFIEFINEKEFKNKSSYRMDSSSYYPYMVGYLHAGLRHILQDLKDGLYDEC